MKIQKLLLYFLAAGALFIGCEPKEEQPTTPMLNVSPSEVKVEQGGGSVAVSVTSNRPWSIETDADWLNFSPANGQASDAPVSVSVSALANSGNDRTATFKVKTEFDFRTITVTQPGAKGEDTTDKPSGNGTKESPYNPAGVVAYINTLAADTESPDVVYVTGKISEVVTTYEASGTYGNATFYMSEDGSKNLTQFYVFQTYYLGNKKWKSGQTDVKAGDVVTVCGKVVNFRGNTPETVSKGGSYVCTLNGTTEYGGGSGDKPAAKGKGTVDDPYNPSAAADAVANLTWTSTTEYQTTDFVYVKGKISKIADNGSYTEGGTYGNASFYIVEDGTDYEFYVFRALYLGNKKFQSGQTDIKVGDEVIVCGKLMNYRGNTPETVSGSAYLYSLNGETAGGGGSSSDYENATAKTVAEFISAADENTYYKLTGTVSKFNSKYCSLDLTDATGTIYVYSVANKDDWSSKISDGGTVTLAGKYLYYQAKQQHEVVDAYILSFEGGSGGGQGGDVSPKGSGTLEDPYNPAAAAAAVANLTWTSNDDYQSTDVVYVKGKISSIANKGTFTEGGTYGNASFYISEDGSSDGTFYVFRTLYLGNEKFESGQTDIKVGDEVIICGKLMNYKGNTPETVAGSSYLYSLNGKTEAGEGGGEQGGGNEGGQSAGSGSVVSGNVETVTFANCGLSNSTQYKVINGTNVKISFGDGGNDGKYYNTGTGMRIYGNGYVQIASEKTITKIVYTFQNDKSDTAPYYPTEGNFSINDGSVSLNAAVATWTGSSKSVKMTRPTGNGHWRLQKVEVTFAE